MAKAKSVAGTSRGKAANRLDVEAKDGVDTDLQMARLTLEPGLRHAAIGSSFAAGAFSDNHKTPIMSGAAVVGEAMAKGRSGDKAWASNLLAAQAMTLDTIFIELARRSSVNMGEYLNASDRYMRLALKAQANCRATLEALSKLHQPREQTVKHVHVNEGGQAVVADQFHQHTGASENGKSNEQPHATGTASASPALPSPDPQGNGMPISGGKGESPMPHARGQGQRRTKRKP